VFGHTIQASKIVPTLYDARNKVCIDVLKQIQNDFYELVSDPIRINAKLKEAPAAKKSIFDYASSSRGAQDYTALVKLVVRDEEKRDIKGKKSPEAPAEIKAAA
jgi:chromosome partitioning protein